jgi:Fe-S cluster biogenesis protein NfuA
MYYPKKGETIVFRLEGACPSCAGTGLTLTAFGAEIMEMVRRRLDANPPPIPDRVKEDN